VPCAAVSQAATPRQRHAACRLDGFGELECGPAPLLVLVGRAMEPLLRGETDELVGSLIAAAAETVQAEEL
jgi:uroporphyrin-III C-methyltransferase